MYFFAIYATLNERRFDIRSYLLSCASIFFEAFNVDAILYIYCIYNLYFYLYLVIYVCTQKSTQTY
jgi:hypothetical protein